jgi:hypothetical protein
MSNSLYIALPEFTVKSYKSNRYLSLLKGLCHEVFLYLWFFSSNNSIWASDMPFGIYVKIRIHRDISWHSPFKVEFLGECESIFKKALARGSMSPEELLNEKTRGRKSHDTVPLMEIVKK